MFAKLIEIERVISSGNLELLKEMFVRYEMSLAHCFEYAVKHNQKKVINYLLDKDILFFSYFSYCVKYDNKEMFLFGLEQEKTRILLGERINGSHIECKYKLIDDIMTKDHVGCLEVIFPILEKKFCDFITDNLCTYFTINRSYKCIRYLLNHIQIKEHILKQLIDSISSRPYVVNFEQKEWREFFQSNILKIQSPYLNEKWRIFKEREEQVNKQLNIQMINDLSKIVRLYEY